MRVSIVNCVSTAAEMMTFSDQTLLRHAEYGDWDYVVVKWLPSPEVNAYLARLPAIANEVDPGIRVFVIEHQTNEDVGYVPNLRAMMNLGFSYGFNLNSYCGLVNTDCYFGPGWLKALVARAGEDRVVNSLHVTRATPPKPVRGIITTDLGEPLLGRFEGQEFVRIYNRNYAPTEYVAPRDDYRQAATMPYLFHRKYWQRCGPWELTTERGTPDVRFFDRVAEAGAEFVLALDSIVYHAEAVERRGARPPGAEGMAEE